MALSDEQIKNYTKRLLLSRIRILCNHGFYGLLLMHMTYSVDENVETACTDGTRIVFGTVFLDKLSDSELDFVMMHEILHVVLQHCQRYGDFEKEIFNIACDIVVNSNILLENNMNKKSITLKDYGESMHITPNDEEGYKYTAEEVYDMIMSKVAKNGNISHKGAPNSSNGKNGSVGSSNQNSQSTSSNKNNNGKNQSQNSSWDDHSRWEKCKQDSSLSDVWVRRLKNAAEAIKIRDPSNSRGALPLFAERILAELTKPQTDWKTILNDFIQEEVTDYSFSPPDRRFDDNPFFLPDFNEKEDMVYNILFMIDTSGSISDEMINIAYSEIKGAIDQFDGNLTGWLGFFDYAVIEPIPFSDVDELLKIKPIGGGGTDFDIIFKYVQRYMQETPPVSIIILTDGYAPFPKESKANGIPVLWLLNNNEVTPPWGKVARIQI